METLEKIKEFLADIGSGDGSGYGDGDGNGSGYGSGSGYGDGDGNGSGYGSGYGCGNGCGYGDGDGDGSGSGNGCGYGNGSGYGYGCGNGCGYGDGDGDGSKIILKKIKEENVFYVDTIPTVFDRIKGNVAHVRIINCNDFSVKRCLVVKSNGVVVHAETLEEARTALREKIFAQTSLEERIEQFKKTFNNTDSYPAQTFFDWHNLLTGSCLAGRKHFIQTHKISMARNYTVKEFIEICENDFGGDIIRRLKDFYK